MPSSLYFKDKKQREGPKAKVKYMVKAKIDSSNDSHDMSYKQILVIREKPVALQEKVEISETQNIKTCCCCDQGPSALKAKFNKNVFTPDETAEGKIEIDNSQCKIAVS